MKRTIIKDLLTGFLCFGLVLFFSCNEESDGRIIPELNTQDEVNIGPLPQRVVISLRASYPWYAESSDSWIKIRKNRGQALKNDSIIVEIEENPLMEERRGWIEVRLMDQMTKKIQVRQLSRGSLITLPKEVVYFNRQGGEAVLDIITEQDWQLETIEGSGFAAEKTTEGKLRVQTETNTSGAIKRQTINLFDESRSVSARMTFIQTTTDDLVAWTMLPEEKDKIVMRAGESNEWMVTLNGEAEAASSDGWIKVQQFPQVDTSSGLVDVNLSVSFDENTTFDERYGYIVIGRKGDLSTISDTLYLTQRASDDIIYVKADAPAGGDGSSWERAFNTIAAGMTAADYAKLKELWVAKGTYQITTTLNWKETNVFGGFEGNERKRKDRKLTEKSTIVGGPFQTMNAWKNENGILIFMDGFIFEGANSTSDYVGNLEIYAGRGFRNCIFRNNKYGKNAGGYFDGCHLINCVFYNNISTPGSSSATLGVSNGSKLINVTVVNNSGAGGGGGGVRMDPGTEAYNSIFWGNKDLRPKGGYHQLYTAENVRLYNCAVQSGDAIYKDPIVSNHLLLGAINEAADGPRFVSLNVGGENFALQTGSPCIDKGQDGIVNSLGVLSDIIGNRRINGPAVDMGAYESQ